MDQDKVRELARQIVAGVASDELDEFDTEADAWFDGSHRSVTGDPKDTSPLGSGLAEVFTTVAPTALFVADHLLAVMTDLTAEEGVRRTAKWLSRGKKTAKDAKVGGTAELDLPELAAAYENDREAIKRAIAAAGKDCNADPVLITKIAARVEAILDV